MNRYSPEIWGRLTCEYDGVRVVLWGEVLNLEAVLACVGLSDIPLDQALPSLVARHIAEEYLPTFNGQFLLMAEWLETGARMIVTDRFATLRLYFGEWDRTFCFYDSLWDLAVSHPVAIAADNVISSMLFGYYVGKGTWLQDVYETKPATIYRIDGGGVTESLYWWFSFHECNDLTFEQAARELHDRWVSAVDRWAVGVPDRLLVPISGGLDSRAILAALMELGYSRRVTTCTWGGLGTFDFEFGGLVARVAGTRHINLPVDYEDWNRQFAVWLDDTQGMLSCLPQFPVLHYREIIRDYPQVMVGYMGDPIMGSHLSPDMLGRPIPDEKSLVSFIVQRHSWSNVAIEHVANLFEIPITNRLQELILDTFDVCRASNNLASFCETWDFRQRQHKFTLYAVFRFLDMARYRTPFIDNTIVEFMTTLPLAWRYRQRLYRHCLANYFPHLFRLPTKNRLGAPLTWGKWQYLSYSFIYRSFRFFKKRVFGRGGFIFDGTNYVEYDRLLPVCTTLQTSLAGWLDWDDFTSKDRERATWQQAIQTASASLTPLAMLFTNRMARKRLENSPLV